MPTTPPPSPEAATDEPAFVAELRRLKAWSGLSFRQLERRAEAAGHILPYSTAATMLGRDTLPREELLVAFVVACGVPEAGAGTWQAARLRILTGDAPARPPAAPRSPRLAALGAALALVVALVAGAVLTGLLTGDSTVVHESVIGALGGSLAWTPLHGGRAPLTGARAGGIVGRMTRSIGRFCFQHRWKVVVAALLVMVAGLACAGSVVGGMSAVDQRDVPESLQARQLLGEGGSQVVLLVEGVDPAADRTLRALRETAAGVRSVPGVTDVGSPAVASDRSGVMLAVGVAPEEETVVRVADRLRTIRGDLPEARVRIGGDAWLRYETKGTAQRDMRDAEIKALPLTFVALAVVFGGPVAAALPLITTVVSVGAAFVVLLALSQVVPLDGNVTTVVTLLGLGLCIDYGLLLVGRYREELVVPYRRAAGRDITRAERAEAVERTWATAGRTVLFSALTVAAALSGLMAFDATGLRAVAAGGVAAALVAMATALTLVAALLSLFGRRIRPSRGALIGADRVGGLFARLVGSVQRSPLLVAVAIVAVLVTLGAPMLGAKLALSGTRILPPDLESVQVTDVLAAKYGRTERPAVLVVARTDPASLSRWAAGWSADPAVVRVEPPRRDGPGLSTVALAVRGDAQGPAARGLVDRVREHRPPGFRIWVAGQAAELVDVTLLLREGLPPALGITAAAMLVLLFLLTWSLTIPLTAVVMAVVSLGATFGAMVLVLQRGVLSGTLHTLTVGGLDPFALAVIFAFAFGLSIDYEVFLIGRIKEHAHLGTRAAIRAGLRDTGRIITSAALLMLVVFGSFAMARMGDIEQIGVGLFVAVLVDATLVRCLLVPSVMTLLGRANWWAPARRLVSGTGVDHREGTRWPA
jgi:RND superfamily putative drug exporter